MKMNDTIHQVRNGHEWAEIKDDRWSMMNSGTFGYHMGKKCIRAEMETAYK